MTLKKKFWYGTTQEDLQTEMRRYSVDNVCGGHPLRRLGLRLRRKTFTLDTDEDAGVALRTCTACGNGHYMGDSASYADEAEPARHPCVCDGEAFELLSGVALYEDNNDVRWYYIGCRCAGAIWSASLPTGNAGRRRRRLPGGGRTRSRRRCAAQ